jgi:hypothetical protein
MSKLAVCFTTLCMLAAPAMASPEAAVATQVDKSDAPARKPASADELAQYAARERVADKQEKYEGGRGRYIEATTLIIILLVVILVLIIL